MKTKKMLINFFSDAIPLIITAILGIFKLKLFLQVLGDETLGLYQLCQQIMVYVALVDGGLSTAVTYALYKPNVEGNNEKLKEILSSAKRLFSIIGSVVFGLAFIASFIAPYLIKDSSFTDSYISICFLLFSLSSVVEYFFVPYQTLLEVKEKKYISNFALQTGQILLSVLEIIMLLNNFSFTSILIMHCIIKLVANVIIMVVCKKIYPELPFNNKKKDYSYFSQIKYLIFNKINGLVGSNIDVLIISKILGLKYVAIYSAYNYIINMLRTILGKILTSVNAIVGNILARDKDSSFKIFDEMNSMLFYVGNVVCVSLVFAINGFINIWYEGEIVTSMLLAVAFSTLLYLFIIKICINVFVNAGGLFKETKFCSLTDTIVNLILSLILVYVFGIPGVIIASCISVFIAEYCMKSYVVYKKIFNKNFWLYHFNNLKFFIILGVDIIIGYFITTNIVIDNILVWFGFYVIFTIINAIFILMIYNKFGDIKFIERFIKFVPGKILNLIKRFNKQIQILVLLIVVVSFVLVMIN